MPRPIATRVHPRIAAGPTRALVVAAAILAAGHAEAIEMFTFFGDGSRIGLPSLEVPIEAYPGIPLRSDRIRARRGWRTPSTRTAAGRPVRPFPPGAPGAPGPGMTPGVRGGVFPRNTVPSDGLPGSMGSGDWSGPRGAIEQRRGAAPPDGPFVPRAPDSVPEPFFDPPATGSWGGFTAPRDAAR